MVSPSQFKPLPAMFYWFCMVVFARSSSVLFCPVYPATKAAKKGSQPWELHRGFDITFMQSFMPQKIIVSIFIGFYWKLCEACYDTLYHSSQAVLAGYTWNFHIEFVKPASFFQCPLDLELRHWRVWAPSGRKVVHSVWRFVSSAFHYAAMPDGKHV